MCVCKVRRVLDLSDRDCLNGFKGIKSYSTSTVVLGTEHSKVKEDSSQNPTWNKESTGYQPQ